MMTDIEARQKLEQMTESLEALLLTLDKAGGLDAKLEILEARPEVQEFIGQVSDDWKTTLDGLQPFNRYLLLCVLVMGQAKLLQWSGEIEQGRHQLLGMLNTLAGVEKSYRALGGLLGYHLHFLKLLAESRTVGGRAAHDTRLRQPRGVDITAETAEVRKATSEGLKGLKQLAVFFPIGGAGERLNLMDESSGEPLPVAKLNFCGRSLVEGMIRDIQAMEYLYFKVFGEQVRVPIAMMTSHEKHNHSRMLSLLDDNGWFGRAKDSFAFFTQPGVPVVDAEGNWVTHGPMELMVKPGGHGVIWQQAKDQGIFDWLRDKECRKALVRQVNNPIAATDYGILAFVGLGIERDKAFGFASCSRLVHAPEGMNVLVERQSEEGYDYTLTNIEYTDFECYGINDVPKAKGTVDSAFPANTNILFADLATVEELADRYPTPGLLVNMKGSVARTNHEGKTRDVPAGRMESTMQNIADYLVHQSKQKLGMQDLDTLPTFLTYNERSKTISVTKKAYNPGDSLQGTPEGCFYDVLCNNLDLLVQDCGFKAAAVGDTGRYMRHGPGCLFTFHPGLGPLYSTIAQKLRGGTIYADSELQLEIADVSIEHLELRGSLLVEAEQVLGHTDEKGRLVYSHQTGRCRLKNVRVHNQGIDRRVRNQYWCNDIQREECCQIILRGHSEFVAENVTLEGSHTIQVPDGKRMYARQVGGEVKFETEDLGEAEPLWTYTVDAQQNIQLKQSGS